MRVSIQGCADPQDALSLYVIFRKRASNYMALLRKITYKDKASYGSSKPCTLPEWTRWSKFSAKEPLIVWLFCGKGHIKIRHPMGLRHPAPFQSGCVQMCLLYTRIDVCSITIPCWLCIYVPLPYICVPLLYIRVPLLYICVPLLVCGGEASCIKINIFIFI